MKMKKIIIQKKKNQCKYRGDKTGFLSNIITDNTNLGGWYVCLDIGVDHRTNQVEDEDDAEATPKERVDLVDRYERRSQPTMDRL